MLNGYVVRKAKFLLLTALMFGSGMLFSSCGLTDIRDNVIAGALAGVKGSTQSWVNGLIPDFNELMEAFSGNPVNTP